MMVVLTETDISFIVSEDRRVDQFLAEYIELCKKHRCMILSDGEAVEAATAAEADSLDDPWGVIETTQRIRKERH